MAQALPALAQATSSTPATPATPATPQVVVTGRTADTSARREFVAGKIIIDRRRIEDSGVRTVEELLKREPSVTVSGDGSIGLLNLPGYTQVLVDGQAPQGGKSNELDLVHVEKIEIVKSSVAEYGPFGIAGTINIVTRKTARKTSTTVTVGAEAGGGGRHGTSVSLAHNRSSALSPLSFGVDLSYFNAAGSNQSQVRQTRQQPGQGEQEQWQAAINGRSRMPALTLGSNLTWQRSADETISFTPGIWMMGGSSARTETRRWQDGATLDVHDTSKSSMDLLRLPLSWSFKPGKTSAVDISLRNSWVRSESSSNRLDTASTQAPTLRDSADRADSRNHSAEFTYKLKLPGGHDLKAGASIGRHTRDIDYTYRIDARPDLALAALGEHRTAASSKRRLYLQDEWRISDSVAMNAGLAGAATLIDVNDGPFRAQGRFRVWSPSVHLSKKLGKDDAH